MTVQHLLDYIAQHKIPSDYKVYMLGDKGPIKNAHDILKGDGQFIICQSNWSGVKYDSRP